MSISKKLFDTTPDGKAVNAYTLTRNGVSATVLTFGGILQSLTVPDKNGKTEDIVCGFDSIRGYLTGGGYHGALIGRYANRIRGGHFVLDGKEIQLNKNENGVCTLHGGNEGFNVKLWDAKAVNGDGFDSLVLSIVSPDGEENFPGNLKVTVTYTLADDRSLTIHYQALTDAMTVVNLTNHSYFNLNGYQNGDINNHLIRMNADRIAAVDDDLLPTGEAMPVDGTKFDLRTFTPVTEAYDHSFFLNPVAKPLLDTVIEVKEPVSGRMLSVSTDLPAVQFYTGNFLGGDVPFKNGVKQEKHHGFCLETQFSPDSPNQPQWASPVLRPGEVFDKTTVFRFDFC